MKKITTRLCLLAAVLLSHGPTVQAQLKDCNAFVQGHYVEVGVNHDGTYGSSVPPPSGYHANVTGIKLNDPACTSYKDDPILGFVADPEKDGWTVASPGMPNYMGDYFTPGAPYEGWGIMSDNKVNTLLGVDSMPSTITGGNARYRTAGSKVGSEWEGLYDSLQIIQRTILDTANTYFIMRVKIKNLAHRSRKDIYYMRAVDPDNDQPWPLGSFATNNTIVRQNPNASNIALVSAVGTRYPDSIDYLAMASKDPRATVFINRLWPVVENLERIYNRLPVDYLFDSLTKTVNEDIGMGIIFKIDSLPAYDSTLLLIAYMFRGDDLGTATDDEGLYPDEMTPTAVKTLSLADNIRVQPNPFDNELLLKGLQQDDHVSLYSIQGKKVEDVPLTGQHALDTRSVPAGTYVLIVTDKEGVVKHRQLVQRK